MGLVASAQRLLAQRQHDQEPGERDRRGEDEHVVQRVADCGGDCVLELGRERVDSAWGGLDTGAVIPCGTRPCSSSGSQWRRPAVNTAP